MMIALSKFYQRYRLWLWPIGQCLAYGLWFTLFRLIVLTFITYYLRLSNSDLGTISDTLSSNEIPIAAAAAFIYILLPRIGKNLWDTKIFRTSETLAAFLQGAVLAILFVLAFLFAGYYTYLGFFMDFDETGTFVLSVILRTLSLTILVFAEEYFFREHLLKHFLLKLPPLSAAAFTGLLYGAFKALQFDIGVMHFFTFFIVSLYLGLGCLGLGLGAGTEKNAERYIRGAVFWMAFLFFIHVVFSLPIFGNEFRGIFLIRYLEPLESGISRLVLFLTGGLGGPLSSFAFQISLLVLVLRALKNFQGKT